MIRPPTVLVVGIGSPDRGDDGVGPAVAGAVASMRLPAVRVVRCAEPMDLLDDGFTTADLVVVIDAVRSGRPPGTVLLREVDRQPLPEGASPGSTHVLGLDATVELARALGRMPRRLVLVGVEADGFEPGEPMSDEVREAVTAATEVVVGVVGERAGGER